MQIITLDQITRNKHNLELYSKTQLITLYVHGNWIKFVQSCKENMSVLFLLREGVKNKK